MTRRSRLRYLRRPAVVAALATLVAAGTLAVPDREASPGASPARRAAAAPAPAAAPTRPFVSARAASINVQVSTAYPDAATRAQKWADFFASLPHGSEIDTLAVRVLASSDLAAACGQNALGCYRGNELDFVDETLGGVSPEEVARHEYGHHIANNRLNPPWPTVDWGPKRWATLMGVCADVMAGRDMPGDEGDGYASNPGEAWAEAYRILAERSVGMPGTSWDIVDRRFFPSDAALAAARQDVLQPWTAPTTSRYAGTFAATGKRTWQRSIATPLDGPITVVLTYPPGPRPDVRLLSADGKTVARWSTYTARSRTIVTTVCGSRSLLVRVTWGPGPGRFGVAVTAP